MKKILTISLGILALLAVSCNKAVTDVPAGETPAASEIISISATLSDIQTKVSFGVGYDANNKPAGTVALAWADGDKLRVYDHADRSKYEDFTIDPACIGQKKGIFTGTAITASSYDAEVINDAFDYASQAQPSDGDTSGLKYLASASDIADYTTIDFTYCSSVLAITAKMPSTEVAAAIKSVELTASEPIFNGGSSLTITLDSTGDADADGILHLFATLPQGSQAIPAGTGLLVHFNAPGTEHTVYTRYMELPAQTFAAGKLSAININATKSDLHAGLTSCDGSSSANPYLIGDKYQLKAIDGLLASEKRYFKLVDNIDMKGESWTKLNSTSPFKPYDFDGNNKTISNLGSVLFYIVNGTVKDLTLDKSNVPNRGILAEYIQGSGNVVSNVTVSNGTVIYDASNAGGLIGYINNGTSADAVTATITDCTVSNTDVSGVGVIGGVVGFADANVKISGCTFTGGSVTATARYCGGFVGSTGNYASVISDCHVEDATINHGVSNNDFRTGGFVGQLQTKVTVQGCSAGSSTGNVVLDLKAPASGKVYNAGGFVGVCYGKITKNGDVRSKAYATVTSANPVTETASSLELNLGGFAGYHTGTIEYSDADASVTACGKYIGGFCGRLLGSGKIQNCTAAGSVSGNVGTGGFVGYAESTSSLDSCSADVAVSRAGTWGSSYGVFAGIISNPTVTRCSASHIIEVNANYVGGFIGGIETPADKTTTISKCWSTGDVTSSSAQCGGFIGHIAPKETAVVKVEDCYVTGNLTKGNQRKGGLVGQINSGIVTIARCYASGSLTSGSFGQGGLVGFMNATATIQDCAAWNSDVIAANIGNANWSSGAVVGVTWPVATLANNFRRPDMNVKAFWGNVTGFTKELAADYDHPDVSSSSPLVVADKSSGELRATTATAAASGQDNYPLFAYHGKHVASGTTLSTLASTAKASGGLGWDSSVWDFTGDLPKLK